MSQQDRAAGYLVSTAIKAPCDVATTANITLSGEQTIDGTLTSSSRVLVKNQTVAIDNGIWISGTGTWTRAQDFDGSRDITQGTVIKVNNGTNLGFWEITSTGTLIPGTSALAFSRVLVANGVLSAPDGSSLVGFLQDGTGAVPRTAQAKMRERVSVSDFGAVGDFNLTTETGTDDTAAFTAAIAAAVDGGTIYIDKPGNYRITSALTISKQVSFVGLGAGSTRLVFENCNGITYSLGSVATNSQVAIRGLAILTTVKGTRTGISFTGYAADDAAQGLTLDECVIAGADFYTTTAWTGQAANGMLEWLVGVSLVEADGSLIKHCVVRGNERCAIENYATATYGIKAEDTTVLKIINTQCVRLATGVYIFGQSEGSVVDGCNIFAVKTGIDYSNTEVPANEHMVVNSHISANEVGIYMPLGVSSNDPLYNNISGNFFLKRIEASGAYYTGSGFAGYKAINFYGNRSTITGNTFATNVNADMVALGNIGINVEGDNNIISHNVFLNPGIAVKLAGDENACMFSVGKEIPTYPITMSSNTGANNLIFGEIDPDVAGLPGASYFPGAYSIHPGGYKTLNITSTALQESYLNIFGEDAASARVELQAASDTLTDVDLRLLPKGAGNIRFGTYTATPGAITGYITIKDAGGTARKIAVTN